MENMRIDRQWINARLRYGFLTDEFEAVIEEFVDFAQRHPELMDGTKKDVHVMTVNVKIGVFKS